MWKLHLKKGFTLVELIIVLAIMGVLAAILIPTATALIEDARKVACDTNIANDERMVQYGLLRGKLKVTNVSDVEQYLKDNNCALYCADKRTKLDISIYEDDIIIYCPKHGEDDRAYMKNILQGMLNSKNIMEMLSKIDKNKELTMDSIKTNDESTFIGKIMKELGASIDFNQATFRIVYKNDGKTPMTAYYIPDRTQYVTYDDFVAQGYEVPEKSASGNVKNRKSDFKAYYAYQYTVDPQTGKVITTRCYVETTSITGSNSTIVTTDGYIYDR